MSESTSHKSVLLNTSKFLVILFFVGLITGMVWVGIVDATPGDVMFFPRLMVERAFFDTNNGDVIQKAENLTVLTENRIDSYAKLAESGECAQLVLAKEELLAKIKEVIDLRQEFTYIDEYSRYLSNVYRLLERAESLNSSCDNLIPISELRTIFQLVLYDSGAFLTKDIYVDIDELEAKVIANSQKLQNIILTSTKMSQSTLDQVNSLYLEGLHDLLQYQKDAGEWLQTRESLIGLLNAHYSFKAGLSLLEDEHNIPSGEWVVMLNTLCLVSKSSGTDGICQPENLSGKLNSVNSEMMMASRLTKGGGLFDDYFKELLPSVQLQKGKVMSATDSKCFCD